MPIYVEVLQDVDPFFQAALLALLACTLPLCPRSLLTLRTDRQKERHGFMVEAFQHMNSPQWNPPKVYKNIQNLRLWKKIGSVWKG